MIRKSHLSVALAGLALFAGSQAFACSTSLWGAGLTGGAGGPQSALLGVTAGQPVGSSATAPKRYAGACGLRSASVGQIVQDGTASAESTYIGRFYAHVNYTAGTPVLFRVGEGAPDAAPGPGNATIYMIQYNSASQRFEAVNSTGVVTPIGAASSALNNRFYHVHATWARTGGTLAVEIQGAGSTTVSASLPATAGFGSSGAAAGPDFAQLGWVSGAATGAVSVDAFESRRSTAITRLCRGDANNDGTRTAGDQIQIRNETLAAPPGSVLAVGTPDCNEDGLITSGDQVCVRNITLSGAAAQPCSTGTP